MRRAKRRLQLLHELQHVARGGGRARDVPHRRQPQLTQRLDDLVHAIDLRGRVGDRRDHAGTHHRKRADELRDPLVGALDAGERLVVNGLQIAVHLLVEHQLFAALRPDAPRVVIDDVGDHQLTGVLSAGQPAELDLQVHQQHVAAPPGVREDVEGQARELGHHRHFLRGGDLLRDDLVGADHRIVRRVVFEEELDHPRHEQRPARQVGISSREGARRDAARDDFERDHVAAAHHHLVVVVVLAAAEIVRGQTAEVEQPEDAGRRLRRQPALPGDLMAPRSVAGRNAVGLRDDHLVRLSGVFVENLRLAARDLAALCSCEAHLGLTRERLEPVDAVGQQARALRGGSDEAAGVEQRAESRPGPPARSTARPRTKDARAGCPRRERPLPTLAWTHGAGFRAGAAGPRRRERPRASPTSCRRRARRLADSPRSAARPRATRRSPCGRASRSRRCTAAPRAASFAGSRCRRACVPRNS